MQPKVDPWYLEKRISTKLTLLVSWLLTFFSNGGHWPTDADGWTLMILTALLILLDGKISLSGAGQVASDDPPFWPKKPQTPPDEATSGPTTNGDTL
jgi:hypothetical protein